MILLIDVGNTRVKWGLLENGKVNFGGAFFYKNLPLTEIFLLHWSQLNIKRVVISNVGGKIIGTALTEWFVANKKMTPEFLFAQQEKFGLHFGYTQPKTFGMDRFFAMLAAWYDHKNAFVLLGCGTATTFDAVTDQGQHLGSLIAPGLYLQHTAMAQLANCSVPEEMAVPERRFGKSTAEAISQGTIQLVAGFFNEEAQRVERQLGMQPRFIITGGDAESISPLLFFAPEYRPHIVLEGLALFLTAAS